MGWVFRIVLLVLVIMVVVYVFKRWPVIHRYYTCYYTAYQQYDEKGLVIRRGLQGELPVCAEKKAYLLGGLACQAKTQNLHPLGETEQFWIETAGRWLRFGMKDFETMINEHNQSCPDPSVNLRFDTRTQTWF